jgi:hypothetical protein
MNSIAWELISKRKATHTHFFYVSSSWFVVESNFHSITDHQDPIGWNRVIALSILNLDARRVGWSAPHPVYFPPHGKKQVPIVQEAGCAPGLVWTCAKIHAPNGI